MEALAEVVVVVELVYIRTIIAVVRVLIGVRALVIRRPPVLSVGLPGHDALLIAVVHGALEEIDTVLVRFVVRAAAIVAVGVRRGVVGIVVVVPALPHARLLLAQVGDVLLLDPVLRQAALLLELCRLLLEQTRALIEDLPVLRRPLLLLEDALLLFLLWQALLLLHLLGQALLLLDLLGQALLVLWPRGLLNDPLLLLLLLGQRSHTWWRSGLAHLGPRIDRLLLWLRLVLGCRPGLRLRTVLRQLALLRLLLRHRLRLLLWLRLLTLLRQLSLLRLLLWLLLWLRLRPLLWLLSLLRLLLRLRLALRLWRRLRASCRRASRWHVARHRAPPGVLLRVNWCDAGDKDEHSGRADRSSSVHNPFLHATHCCVRRPTHVPRSPGRDWGGVRRCIRDAGFPSTQRYPGRGRAIRASRLNPGKIAVIFVTGSVAKRSGPIQEL